MIQAIAVWTSQCGSSCLKAIFLLPLKVPKNPIDVTAFVDNLEVPRARSVGIGHVHQNALDMKNI